MNTTTLDTTIINQLSTSSLATSDLTTSTDNQYNVIIDQLNDRINALTQQQSISTVDYSLISSLLLLWIAILATFDFLRRLASKR